MTTRLITFLTTRSQYARVQQLLKRLNEDEDFHLDIVLSGGALTHDFGDLRQTLTEAGLTVSQELHTLVEGDEPITQAKTTGMGLVEFASTIWNYEPDAVLTTGDRYETLATTISASYLNTPVVHLEGGEITGSIDDRVRHATTKMADYHFVSTERSKEIIREMGEPEERIFRTGCPSIDICRAIRSEGRIDYDPQDEYSGVGPKIDTSGEYLIVQYHPVPTEYESMHDRTWELIKAVDRVDMPTFWFWPNPDGGTSQVSQALRKYRNQYEPDNAHFYVNLKPYDFLTLVSNSACVVGNSSVGIRECSFFGTPVVNVGERQTYRERTENVVDVPTDEEEIYTAIQSQLNTGQCAQSTLYGDGTASEEITNRLREIDFSRKGSMEPDDILSDTKLITN